MSDSNAFPTDEKTERLFNLVLALLSRKGFFKKGELLAAIPGYSGSIEARERMFERDKDDLRKAGIPIEVSNTDPLFEDEIGYRIRPSEYGFQLGELTSPEALLLSAALEIFSNKASEKTLQLSKFRIKAASSEENDDSLSANILSPGFNYSDSRLSLILDAILGKQVISFFYQKESDNEIESRILSPSSLIKHKDDWLLTGFDHIRGERRIFNIAQIVGEIEPSKNEFHSISRPNVEVEAWPRVEKKIVHLRVPLRSVDAILFEGGLLKEEDETGALVEFHVVNIERLLRVAISITSEIEVVGSEEAINSWRRLLKTLRTFETALP